MKDYIVPFSIAFVICCIGFVALDFVIMNLQGLTLIYEP